MTANKKKAWESVVLRAYGHAPTWVRSALSAESRRVYRAIDLHFHDLRHEAGSRWLEKGVPLHHIKELLGHASISTTDTYLNASRLHLQKSMLEMEKRGKSGTSVPHDPSARLPASAVWQADDMAKSLLH